MEAHFVGGPLNGTTQQMPEPLPSAWRVAERVDADQWLTPTGGPLDQVTTYLRRATEFAGRRYVLYVAAGVDAQGWRPMTHRCRSCGASVKVRLIPTTTHDEQAAGRRSALWGKAEPCGACGSTADPERVDGWDDVVTWTVG
jgi:hypothetical protein